jgi:hypothetical protein
MDKIQVNKNLNPENCQVLGFKWQYDTIYDPEAPQEANKEFTELLNQGWELGKSASRELEKNGGVGLYKPIR